MGLLAALVIQELFALALSNAIPINTCCPPGHFLAIEDWGEFFQDFEGNWRPRTVHYRTVPAHRVVGSFRGGSISGIGHILEDVEKASERDMLERVYSDMYMAVQFYKLPAISKQSYAKFYWDGPKRHDFMSRVFCVPDQNNMPAIDGATRAESKTLAEDQVLRSKGLEEIFCTLDSYMIRIS